jgi:beta-lactam-binding protein with PASTA domain
MSPDDPAQTSTTSLDDSDLGIHDDRARGLGIALAAVVVALLVLWWIYTQTTVVPRVIGLREEVARESLRGANLGVGAVSEVVTRQQPAGRVADQAPVEGARVLKGSLIDLAVSAGSAAGDGAASEEGIPGYDPSSEGAQPGPPEDRNGGGGVSSAGPWVPDVQALTESQARSRLRAAGYGVRVKRGPVTTGPGKGKVYYQDPEPDAEAPRGTVVEIWISTGGPGTGNSDYPTPYAKPGE